MPDLLLVARQERPAPGLVSSDFDQRRRWLIVTVVGLFGLSVLMLGLHLVDSGRVEAARPDAAVVVAPSVASEAVPPAAPAPKVKPAPGPQRAAPRVGGSSVSNPLQQGLRYAEMVPGRWSSYIPRMLGLARR